MICVSLGNINFTEAFSICEKEALVEIRADLLDIGEDKLKELLNAGARTVFTLRKSHYSDEERLRLYRMALSQKSAFIDLDADEDKNIIKQLKDEVERSTSRLILSYHNFDLTPERDELGIILKRMYKKGADIAKIACLVQKDKDTVNLLSLYRKPGNKIILGMGEKGMISRVAAVFMGAEFTYASPDEGMQTAPGQLTRQELEEIFEIMRP